MWPFVFEDSLKYQLFSSVAKSIRGKREALFTIHWSDKKHPRKLELGTLLKDHDDAKILLETWQLTRICNFHSQQRGSKLQARWKYWKVAAENPNEMVLQPLAPLSARSLGKSGRENALSSRRVSLGDVTAHGRVQDYPSRERLGTRLMVLAIIRLNCSITIVSKDF